MNMTDIGGALHYLSAEREIRRQELEDAQPKTTDAQAMIDQIGKRMLEMTADEIERAFGRQVRRAFDRGYLHGNSSVIFAEGGLLRRACQSGISQRIRIKRAQQAQDSAAESWGAI